ncbi:hypothetical protein [uncultured Friedmanniella sp.]|uniref:hypothetical protein n=1 Tax=uncultured Friedmanniella sp. TaxID=335381 RepID=UPI0035CA2A4C
MRGSKRKVVQSSVVLSLAVGSLLWHTESAAAAPGCLTSSSDFDRDGVADIVVGIPGGSGRHGSVQVRLSNGGHALTRTITGAPGFGSAVTSLSSYTKAGDEGLCSQLVVGSPDESVSTGRSRSGALHVYAWDAGRRQFVSRGAFGPGSRGVAAPDQAGARFGASLAAKQHRVEDGERGPDRLYVGAPGFDVDDGDGGAVRDAGHVVSFVIDDGADPQAHRNRTLDYSDEDGAGGSTVGGRLGSSLSVGGGLVAAGAPGQTVRGAVGAGAVLVEKVDAGPDDFMPEELSQATAGVPGTPEKGDRFGAAVHLTASASGRPTLAVGAPGEDLRGKADTGAVTLARISLTTGEPVGSVRSVDQDTAGVAGTAEPGDAFGSALSSTGAVSAQTFLVGSPGEDVGRARNAGMVQTIGHGTGWTQDTTGVPGQAETGDRMGASLGGSTASGADKPLIGVPGEDSSTGAVIVGLPRSNHPAGYLKGTKPGGRYGFAVAQ